MFTNPVLDITAKEDDRFGIECMKAGPAEKGMGGKGRIVRKSYILTKGSGNGCECLTEISEALLEEKRLHSPFSHSNREYEVSSSLQTFNRSGMSFNKILAPF